MSETSAKDAPSLPNSVAWFTPWRWRPWTRWALAGVLLIGYVVSPLPFYRALDQSGIGQQYPVFMTVFETIYAPVEFAYDRSSVVEAFYDWQNATLDKMFDEPIVNRTPSGPAPSPAAPQWTPISLPEGMPPMIAMPVEVGTDPTVLK